MAIHDAGMFTVKGINRLKILQDAIDRNLHPGQAAEMLGITPRHCRRLLKRYRQLGPLGMNNHSRGRVGNHLLPTSLIDQALCIIREHYRDFGPTLALENLEEVHGLVLGKDCDHHWFESWGRPCTALVYVDYATSRLMHLLFVKSESTD